MWSSLPSGSGVESSTNAPFRISSKDVKVTQAAKQLPFRLSKGGHKQDLWFPPHLLVLYEHEPTADQISALAGSLLGVTRLGWQVSIASPQGTILPYGANPSTAKVATNAAGTGNYKGINFSVPALESLETFAGRRVLLVCTAGALRREELTGLVSRFEQIYVMDGGIRESETHTFYPVDSQGFDLSVDPVETARTVTVHNYNRGVVHEVSVSGALKDLIRDERYYYDLVVQPGTPNGQLGRVITVQIHDPQRWDVFDAELYTTPSGLVRGERKRTPAPDLHLQLQVKQ